MMFQQSARSLTGRPNSVAKTFIVPIGKRPSVACVPARPWATSLMVPSPPAATIFSKPSLAPRRAINSASPVQVVAQTTQSAASDSTWARLRWARSLFAAGFKIIRVLLISGRFRFHLFFKLALRNVLRVQKFGRLALILIGGLSIFAAIVFLGLNLYVQSQGTQARIQQELRHRFGAALKIGRISVTPWSGLKLSDITIAQTTIGGSANFLEAKSFALRVAFFSLFSRQLVIKEVTLVNPNVVAPQNAEVKWRLPDLRGEQSKNGKPIAAKSQSLASAESENTNTAATEKSAATPAEASPPPVERKLNAPPGLIS